MGSPQALSTSTQRSRMVQDQLVARGVRDARVLEAMGELPRERFLPEGLRDRAYVDGAQAIGHAQTISQPYIVAYMAEALEIAPQDRVLEIGAGSGYAAAVMARLGREVVAIERIPDLAEGAAAVLTELEVDNVRVLSGDYQELLPLDGPFDVISVAAAASQVPQLLLDQLAPGGRLIGPIGEMDGDQHLVRVYRGTDGGTLEERLIAVRFVPLVE